MGEGSYTVTGRQPLAAPLAGIDAVILCGGLGTRLRGVIPEGPKSLAFIGDRPFLDILIEDLLRQGLRRFVLCVGYLKEQFIDRYGSRCDAQFVFSEESIPLGTGGAVQHARQHIRSSPFLLMNGDSLCRVDLKKFLVFHRDNHSTASFVVSPCDVRNDGGVVCLDGTNRVQSFLEKTRGSEEDQCYLNAGVYLLEQGLSLLDAPRPPFSLEHDVFPQLIENRTCFGFVTQSQVVDIGTPERYASAEERLR
jgi:NDP-sugar pyrophosphorylase family protein